MEAVLFLGVILGAVLLMLYVKQQDDQRRFAQLGAVACSVCGQEGVKERGEGSYACSRCGYDTDADLPAARQGMVREIQELSIAISCLSSAKTEFNASRYRTHQVTRDGRRTTESVGPFHERYLEGLEQAEEASRILELQVDDQPALGAGIDAISRISPPAEGRAGFNTRVSEATAGIEAALSSARAVRAERVAAFQKG